MSRIAKNSIKIDKELLCSFQNGIFSAKGKLGEMNLPVDPLYTVDIQETEIFVNPKADKDKLNPKWGTMRSLPIKGQPANKHEGLPVGPRAPVFYARSHAGLPRAGARGTS